MRQFGPWYADKQYGLMRDLLPIGSNSAMDAAPEKKAAADASQAGAVIPDSPFGGRSAYDPTPVGAPSRPINPRTASPAEIKKAYEELRALVASVAHRYGPIPPNVVFTTEEQGASVLQALSDLVANSSSVAYSISATPATKRSGADRAILDSWMHAQRVLSAVRNGADNAYAALAGMRGPSGMDAQPERDPVEFFNGVPYNVGRQRYEEYLAARALSTGRTR